MLTKWVERKRNPSWAFSHVTAGNEFRFAQSILLVLATLLAIVPLANAQSIEEKAQACATCHGENGIPADKSSPVIWGQHQGYLYVQLRDFKNGLRKSEVMELLARALQRDEMLAIALYFSKLTWPGLHQLRAEAPVAARALHISESVGCTDCHKAKFQAEGVFPRLAGQSAVYLLKAMKDFRISARTTYPAMTEFMNAMSEDDLNAMAVYLAGL
jgi:cytochrome c553